MAELIFQGGTIMTLDAQFRIARGDLAAFDQWLAASPKAQPVPGDEKP